MAEKLNNIGNPTQVPSPQDVLNGFDSDGTPRSGNSSKSLPKEVLVQGLITRLNEYESKDKSGSKYHVLGVTNADGTIKEMIVSDLALSSNKQVLIAGQSVSITCEENVAGKTTWSNKNTGEHGIHNSSGLVFKNVNLSLDAAVRKLETSETAELSKQRLANADAMAGIIAKTLGGDTTAIGVALAGAFNFTM